MDTHPIYKKLLPRLRIYKLDDAVVESTVLFHELTPGSELKSGYILINGTECCWHTWVEHEGKRYDFGFELASKNDSGFKNVHIGYLTEKPVDMDVQEEQAVIDRFNGHIADFWKTAPKNFREFRTKFKRSLNK
jgi:hypothetical protein|tara:strand:+ start:147 stop:548 length:402 start_codon:yes stop_codon:yes gene_type:complete